MRFIKWQLPFRNSGTLVHGRHMVLQLSHIHFNDDLQSQTPLRDKTGGVFCKEVAMFFNLLNTIGSETKLSNKKNLVGDQIMRHLYY